MFFTPLLPGGVIGTDTGTLRRQVKVKRKTQPNQSMTIDWSNPITKGLIFAYNGVTNTDLVKGARGDKQNIAVDSIGQGTNITGTTDVVTISNVNNLPTTNNLSLFSLFTTTVSPATQSATNFYGGLFCKRNTIGVPGPSMYFAGGTLSVTTNNSVGTRSDFSLSGNISSVGRTTACVTGSISGSVGYINGKQTGTGIVPYWPANTNPWYIGLIRADATTENLQAIHHLDLCWNRTLTAAEVASLNANPWQIVKSTPQTMVATRGIVSRPNSDLSVTNNTITIRRQIKVKRKTQPQMATQIDWSNPVTKGLVLCTHAGNNFVEMTTHKPSVITSAVSTATPKGKALANASSTFSIETGVNKHYGEAVTWVFGAQINSFGGGGFGRIFDKNTAAVPASPSIDSISVQSGFGILLVRTGSVTNQQVVTNLSLPAPYNIYAVSVSSFTATDGAWYINGVPKALNNQTGAGVMNTNTANYVLGNRTNDYLRNLDGKMDFAYRWNRVLSPAEVRSISNNPYQIFKSTPQTMVYTKLGWSYNSNTSLYDAIDEPSYNDTDAIISPNLNASPEPAKFGLDTSLDAGTYNVNVRARRTDTTGDIRATLIDSAGNVVGTSSWQTLTAIYQTYVLSVTTTATASRVGLEVRA